MSTTDDEGRSEVLDARHVIAAAAYDVARVAAEISRALAWRSSVDHVPACVVSCEAALQSLRCADRKLQEAIVRLRLGRRDAAPSAPAKGE